MSKEKKRKEKLASKEKKKKEKEARVKAAKERKKNYRDLSLPAKPPKPVYDKEAFELINQIRSGEFEDHIYDKYLQILATVNI